MTQNAGSAAVEMALVMPFLLVLMFGSFELGNYYLDNHVIAKAVRDGARFASRRVPLKGSCVDTIATTNTSGFENEIKNVTVYGTLAAGTARISNWVPAAVTISYSCKTTGSPTGLYSEMTDHQAPVVTVSATASYVSFFGNAGFSATNLNLVARSEVPVMGL